MSVPELRIKSVAIIGAGAAGSVTAAALKSENYFEKIKVFERRETAGGTWIYDPLPDTRLPFVPGALPPSLDPPVRPPNHLPKTTSPNLQVRFTETPVYSSLTTNVPSIAMSFSDLPFPFGPFVPHHIPNQYIQSYVSYHQLDHLFVFNTTVEDVSKTKRSSPGSKEWKLTLRRYDGLRDVDEWWHEEFDAVIFANGHYSVPYIPKVKGLVEYMKIFPSRIVHSKTYRSPHIYSSKRVLVIGNSASGHDITAELVSTAKVPVYQSRRSKSRWDGDTPPDGVAWKPIIKEFVSNGRIIFEDDTYLDDIDTVIYSTGYLPSFPFWNCKANGRDLWCYEKNRILNGYHHTFFQDFKTLAIVGLPRVLTFRSFEYQAVAIARLWSGRNKKSLPEVNQMKKWEVERELERERNGKKFHDVEWETGETLQWLQSLYDIAGLRTLVGDGRTPPVLGKDVRWAIEHVKKYPEPVNQTLKGSSSHDRELDEEWVVVSGAESKDLLSFI